MTEVGPFIEAYAKEHGFNGTVLVRKQGKVAYQGSFGLANMSLGVPNTTSTKYRIASITKLFTSVLILQLQGQGRIDLEGKITDYLPDYAGEGANKVSIHQLLNHTSGIHNFDQVKSMEEALSGGLPPYQTPYTLDQLLARFGSGPLDHPPGTVFDYNNGDYLILGKIVERVYGQPFDQVLQARILRPLGMADTGLLKQRDIVHGLASTYFYRDDLKTLVNDLPSYPENWHAAGAMYSTVADLVTFSDALFGGRLIKPEALERMLTPGLDDYGYGAWVYDAEIDGRKHRIVKRPGQIMGAQTQLYHFLGEDITIILLANSGATDLDEFVAEIGKRVARMRP
ncbi:CubicO group peptidase (beta-lactamase class C family) [Lysobacter niabensis]|uniref:CubicO group peptidase (Beta-lactamase class C family) n=1 Tax=Agrilutibacter niabensis TaxID=380628 RepID=A0ABU1VNC4_9GAMM|nr:serine hydrolase domain-containing protein [Lysobacter niabensis]MDR7098980.1 CubicO group peptidase (beta-lactamase class C family) [Lysobacter niabensis]